MNVLHVSPSFYPAHVYGGPIESVYHLCRHLMRANCDVRVLSTHANGRHAVLDVPTDRETVISGVPRGLRVRYCRRYLCHSVSPGLLRWLPSYVAWSDVVHLTAVYSFPTIPTLLACRHLAKPLIWSPRGALQRWHGHRRPRLKRVWDLTCREWAPPHFVLHATSPEEAEESARRFPGAATVIIPNGVEIPNDVRHVVGNGPLRLLYLGRIDPKKGIDNILSACHLLTSSGLIAWTLTIAGSGAPQYVRKIRARIAELALTDRITMIGHVVGQAKQRAFEEADVVVVPSYTENFAMVVAEALGYGVPVVVGRATPWKRVEEIGCGLWVDNDPESLAKAVEEMWRRPRREMGERGRAWIAADFSWEALAKRMYQLYEEQLAAPR